MRVRVSQDPLDKSLTRFYRINPKLFSDVKEIVDEIWTDHTLFKNDLDMLIRVKVKHILEKAKNEELSEGELLFAMNVYYMAISGYPLISEHIAIPLPPEVYVEDPEDDELIEALLLPRRYRALLLYSLRVVNIEVLKLIRLDKKELEKLNELFEKFAEEHQDKWEEIWKKYDELIKDFRGW